MTNPIWTEIDKHTRGALACISYLEWVKDNTHTLDSKNIDGLIELTKEELKWLLICIDNQAFAIKHKQDMLKRVEKEKLAAFKEIRKVMREYAE